MGNNVIGAIPAFAEHLSKQAAKAPPQTPDASSNSVYFDLCGLWMISYTASTAKWLHSVMLPLVLLFPPPGVGRAGMGKAAGMCLLSMLASTDVRCCFFFICVVTSKGVGDSVPSAASGCRAKHALPAVLCYACCTCICF